MKLLFTLVLLLSLTFICFGQTDETQTKSDSAQPDRWHGGY
jgi:hypothetical protein